MINHDNLISLEEVIEKYPSLKRESKASTLSMRLAWEAYFGDDILVKCTMGGLRDDFALPVANLNLLKEKMFSLFPQFWGNPAEFEGSIWRKCTESIGQACKRQRLFAAQKE